jgi:CubicO group peptidase (beta-lactamase class C family)
MTVKKIFLAFALLLTLSSLFSCRTTIHLEYDKTDDIAARTLSSHQSVPDEVKSIVDPIIKSQYAHGVIVGVYLPDGQKQFYGFGSATEKVDGPPPNGKTLIALGSLSKGYLAALASVLVSEKVLSWDDTLEKLLPPDIMISPTVKKITLLELAKHISGLPKQPNDPKMIFTLAGYTFSGKNIYDHLDQQYVFNFLSQYEVPEKKVLTYSNIGYGLMSYIIETKTGRPVDALIEEKILKPLSLNNTSYHPENLSGYDLRAHGHAGDQPAFIPRGHPLPDWTFTPFLKSSTSIYSTAEDVLSFGVAHLETERSPLNKILGQNLMADATPPLLQPTPQIQWVTDRIENQTITYQIGLVSGYSSYIGIDREKKIVVVVLQNTFNWREKIGHRLIHRLLNHVDTDKIDSHVKN